MASLKEPREDAIMDIGSITGLRREDAIRWLKAYDNDANKAMDAFFENPNAIHDQQSQVKFDEQQGQVGWNEDHFHADKTDNTQPGQNQLGVRHAEALRPGVFNDSAPTRPPSRVSARAIPAANDQSHGLESEDEQMKLAMAMSMGDSQTLPDQEMGVLEHNTLRPATREHYETEKWAMTVAEPQTQEIFLNPDPTDRKRVMGGPAFFKPSPAGHRLPALLKILHAIPMARETLLNRTYTLPDYGVDKDWWDGTPIKFLRVVNLDLEGRQVNSDDLLYESQRLMAFLDETERAYGSTDALAKLEVFKDSHIDKVTDFYVGWHDATFHSVPGAPLADVFKSVGTKVSMDNPQSEPFYCLNARIDGEIAGKGLTLHDVLGHVLWSDNQADEETYLEKVGDVFTLEVCNQVTNSSGLGIEVPATWYVDRYLPSFAKQIKNMLSRKAQASADWDAQEKAQAGMALYTGSPTGANIDASRLLSRAITYFEQTADYRGAIDDSSKTNAGFENDPPTSKTVGELAQELKALEASIAAKMRDFEEARRVSYAQKREISQMYTKPSDDAEQPLCHKYTLRGVATTPHSLYVLERTEPEDVGDMLSTEAKDWQWWKLEFVSNDTKPVIQNKVTEDIVLKAASTDSATALLVYASEAAVSYQSEDLPQQLHNFIRADNLIFSKELEGSGHPQSATPIKRKVHHQHDSDDLEDHPQRSPPHDRSLVGAVISNEDLDPNPPGYNANPSPPPILSHHQNNTHQVGNTRSFDDIIPASLQGGEPTNNHNESLPDQARMSDGHEMQERGRGQGFLSQVKGQRDQYAFSSYVPEIDMEDDEDEDQRLARCD